jgi:RNA polymerase sigma-70 factor (ECF subfamily)
MPFDQLEESFDRAVRAHGADLYRYAYRLCRDRSTAEDLVQEALARGWRGWKSLRQVASANRWLRSILRHEKARRWSRLLPNVVLQDPADLAAAATVEPDTLVELQQLIERLPSGYREPLVMQIVDGLSCSEIARTLNTTEAAVFARLARARRVLRSQLDEDARGGVSARASSIAGVRTARKAAGTSLALARRARRDLGPAAGPAPPGGRGVRPAGRL